MRPATRYDNNISILQAALTESDQPQARGGEGHDEADEHQIHHHHVPIHGLWKKVYRKARQWEDKEARDEVKEVSSRAHVWPLPVVLLLGSLFPRRGMGGWA